MTISKLWGWSGRRPYGRCRDTGNGFVARDSPGYGKDSGMRWLILFPIIVLLTPAASAPGSGWEALRNGCPGFVRTLSTGRLSEFAREQLQDLADFKKMMNSNARDHAEAHSVPGNGGEMTKLKNFEVVFFIVSLPFLWIVWHVCPRHRRYFWSDMKELALLSLLCIFLAGCAGPQLRLGAPQAVSVPDKAGIKPRSTTCPSIGATHSLITPWVSACMTRT